MTTARTSQLIVRETEAEDQRRITIVLSIVAPEEHEPLFERSVTFVASLLWQLTERAYPVRLIVGTEDSGLGSGSAHLLAMLRLLALCERQLPEADGVDYHDQHAPQAYEGEWGYTVAVIPWSGQAVPTNTGQADRVLHATQLEGIDACLLIRPLPSAQSSSPPRPSAGSCLRRASRFGLPSPQRSSSSSRSFTLEACFSFIGLWRRSQSRQPCGMFC